MSSTKWVLILAASLSCASPNAAYRQAQTGTVNICDLLANEDRKFDDEIRISGVYFSASEASALGDPKCGWHTWVEFSPSALEGAEKAKTDDLLHVGDKWDAKVDVVLRGKWMPSRPMRITNGLARKQGYGHLGAYDFQFVVTKVEYVGQPYSAYQ